MANIRIGDSVLVRGKVVPTTQGSTSSLHPGIDFGVPVAILPADKFEIVTIEQAFRVGDRVRIAHERYGEILALSPLDVDPPQAWVKEEGKWPTVIGLLSALVRVDT